MTMTFKNGLALSADRNLLNPLATSFLCKYGEFYVLFFLEKSLSSGVTGWNARIKKLQGSDTSNFISIGGLNKWLSCINIIYRLHITLEHYFQWSENNVVKRLKLPRIPSTRSRIDVVWSNSNITLHAQIYQVQIYSPSCPPVSESVIIYAEAANIALMDERIYEMNRIFNHGFEIKWSYDPHSYESNVSNCLEKPEKFRVSTGLNLWPRNPGPTSSQTNHSMRELPSRSQKYQALITCGSIAQFGGKSNRHREVMRSNPVEAVNFLGFSTQLLKITVRVIALFD